MGGRCVAHDPQLPALSRSFLPCDQPAQRNEAASFPQPLLVDSKCQRCHAQVFILETAWAWPAGTGDEILPHGKEDQAPASTSHHAPARMWLGQRALFSCLWPAPHQVCPSHCPGTGRASCWALVAAKAQRTQTCLRVLLNLGLTHKGHSRHSSSMALPGVGTKSSLRSVLFS